MCVYALRIASRSHSPYARDVVAHTTCSHRRTRTHTRTQTLYITRHALVCAGPPNAQIRTAPHVSKLRSGGFLYVSRRHTCAPAFASPGRVGLVYRFCVVPGAHARRQHQMGARVFMPRERGAPHLPTKRGRALLLLHEPAFRLTNIQRIEWYKYIINYAVSPISFKQKNTFSNCLPSTDLFHSGRRSRLFANVS